MSGQGAIAQAVKRRRERRAGRVGRPASYISPEEAWADEPIQPFKAIEDLLGRPLTELEQKAWLLAGLLDNQELE